MLEAPSGKDLVASARLDALVIYDLDLRGETVVEPEHETPTESIGLRS